MTPTDSQDAPLSADFQIWVRRTLPMPWFHMPCMYRVPLMLMASDGMTVMPLSCE